MVISDAPQIYLVGVNHRLQYTNIACGPEWAAKLEEFEDYLVAQVIERRIELLAEEFNEELLKRNNATACTVRNAASRARCGHCFCEPSSLERKSFGEESIVEAREDYWLERLKQTGANSVVFVCGNDHISTFGVKLEAAGYQTFELSKEWGKDWQFCE